MSSLELIYGFIAIERGRERQLRSIPIGVTSSLGSLSRMSFFLPPPLSLSLSHSGKESETISADVHSSMLEPRAVEPFSTMPWNAVNWFWFMPVSREMKRATYDHVEEAKEKQSMKRSPCKPYVLASHSPTLSSSAESSLVRLSLVCAPR